MDRGDTPPTPGTRTELSLELESPNSFLALTLPFFQFSCLDNRWLGLGGLLGAFRFWHAWAGPLTAAHLHTPNLPTQLSNTLTPEPLKAQWTPDNQAFVGCHGTWLGWTRRLCALCARSSASPTATHPISFSLLQWKGRLTLSQRVGRERM